MSENDKNRYKELAEEYNKNHSNGTTEETNTSSNNFNSPITQDQLT